MVITSLDNREVDVFDENLAALLLAGIVVIAWTVVDIIRDARERS